MIYKHYRRTERQWTKQNRQRNKQWSTSRTEGQKDNGQNKIDKGTNNDLQAVQKNRKTMDKTK